MRGCIPRNFCAKSILNAGDYVEVRFYNRDYDRNRDHRRLDRELLSPWLPTLVVELEVCKRDRNRYSLSDES